MKKTTSFNKSKLAGYAAVAGAVVTGGAANAQITYVDVNPDVTVDSLNPYVLDFNNDQTPDFAVAVQHIEGSFTNGGATYTYVGALAYAYPIGGGVVTTAADNDNAATLNCGTAIDATSVFGANGYGNLGYAALINGSFPFTSSGTPFLGATDKYMGFKANYGGADHYGWIKLSVAANAETITVKEYAVNSVAGEGINACQTAGLEDVKIEDKVSINTSLNGATINVTPDLIGGSVSLVSMSGQIVKTVKIADVNTSIAFDGVETGIYTVSAKFDGGLVSKRVYVK
ncbi:MAG: hypothetical protein RL264_2473 [Bacteroidota bacterium]|jgi:hypothetical protein